MDLINPPLDDDPNRIFGYKLSALADAVLDGDGISTWEFDFVIEMIDRFEKGLNFSDKQVEKVNELYDKHCQY